MLRNYLAAALRNIARNRLYAAINIIGLAVGFAAALLIALFVRDEYSYDTWIPGHERVYLLRNDLAPPGRTPVRTHRTPLDLADALKLDFPQVEAIARVMDQHVNVRHGETEANETIYWADPDFLDVLPLPVIAGDPKTALAAASSVVLTRRMARKYFGRDTPIGETLELQREVPLRVTAVIEDLPPNTQLATEIIVSDTTASSLIAGILTRTLSQPQAWINVAWTYVRLKPGVSASEVEQKFPAFLQEHKKAVLQGFPSLALALTPLSTVHLFPDPGNPMKPADDPATVTALAVIGILILVVAAINFVNLMTARATRRAIEVGVRKTSGATRPNLMVQFLGESLLYVGVGALVAGAALAVALPRFNAMLDRQIMVRFDPALAAGIVGVIGVIGVLAGVYPAFMLSAFRPAAVLKSAPAKASGSGRLRRALVVIQFAILIGLIIGTGMTYRQTMFALNEGLRFDKDQVLIVATSCQTSFADQVRALAGVRAAACSATDAPGSTRFENNSVHRDGGQDLLMADVPVDPGYFEVFGQKAVAGRLFVPNDLPAAAPKDLWPTTPDVVVNETAVRRLGFSSADQAIGQTLLWPQPNGQEARSLTIVGVVPDFSVDSVRTLDAPMFYFINPIRMRYLNVKLTGKDVPETLRAIDALWKEVGEPKPIARSFLDQEIQRLYLDITRRSQVFGIFAGVAIFIACLGLFGLAAFTAESRTKEMGVRKAMGASRTDILRLILWEFAKPVLWANLIAWPAGYFVMRRWLQGFAYHVDLSPWVFLAASALAVVIAVATVTGHALLIARSQPVAALRYE